MSSTARRLLLAGLSVLALACATDTTDTTGPSDPTRPRSADEAPAPCDSLSQAGGTTCRHGTQPWY